MNKVRTASGGPLRVASCINSMSPSGGTELNAVRTVEELRGRGHEVSVVTLTDDRTGMYDRYVAAGVQVRGFPVDSLVGLSALKATREMASYFREQRIDLVHSHDCYTNFLMIAAARLARVPSLASKRYIQHFKPAHRYTDRIGFRLATGVLANSRMVGESVQKDEGIPGSKVAVIHNFVDDSLFSAPSERAFWRETFGLPDNALVIAIVAQLREEKNHTLLLEAFSTLAVVHHTAHLVIVGDGPERENIVNAIERLGLAPRVTMAGHVGQAWRVFSIADVSVLPSRHEGFPNSVVEAMAMGVPVVASDVGGIPDAIVDGTTGLLVPVGDVKALEGALSRMLTDEEFRKSAGCAARKRAAEDFRASVVIDRVEALYGRLIEESA